jgi:hypothetical protein
LDEACVATFSAGLAWILLVFSVNDVAKAICNPVRQYDLISA